MSDAEAIKAIDDVYKKLENRDLKDALEESLEDENNFKKAIEESLKNTTTRKKTPPGRINPLTNRGTPNNSKTRKNITGAINSDKKIMAVQTTEKHTLESQLPPYLNGANVDIIERDGHCFFRSITHQLRQYGFIISNEYQVVRNFIADYIDNEPEITDITISSESPGYSDKQAYTNAIKKSLWGGQLEIRAIHDGCLSSLTDGQAFKIIVYSMSTDGTIGLHPKFLHTIPNGEEEQLITRWPIRLLFVGDNHFHRIYFEGLVRQKQNYVEETRNIGPNTGQVPSRPTTAQLKRMGLLESSPRPNEWGLSQQEIKQQIKALTQIYASKRETALNPEYIKTVMIDENSDEYLNLIKENLSMPFMIMGYQNGEPNLLYKSEWDNFISADDIPTSIGHIYIPEEDVDITERKFTRYPNPTMLNVNGKTIVNISLHRWANIWNDDNNIPLGTINDAKNSGQKSLSIYMTDTNGVEEVIGTEGADFTSILLDETPVLYMRHGERGMAFSPDTGVIALDDSNKNPSCTIHVTDPTDGRKLILVLYFHRQELKPGGKSRRRNTRKPRKHQRRRTKRRRGQYKRV